MSRRGDSAIARDGRYRLDAIIGRVAMGITFRPPVVHRDLKPQNLMRRRSDGSFVLIDFGSVRAAVNDSGVGGSTVAGTLGYMAAEWLASEATAATDVSGAGANVQIIDDNEQLRLEGETRASWLHLRAVAREVEHERRAEVEERIHEQSTRKRVEGIADDR